MCSCVYVHAFVWIGEIDDEFVRTCFQGCVFCSLYSFINKPNSPITCISGSEFIHACPSKDIIPVYIVVSGCLAVLLSSLKQEYDPEARCESNLKLYTALFSITVNLLWLITGTCCMYQYCVVCLFPVWTHTSFWICKPTCKLIL